MAKAGGEIVFAGIIFIVLTILKVQFFLAIHGNQVTIKEPRLGRGRGFLGHHENYLRRQHEVLTGRDKVLLHAPRSESDALARPFRSLRAELKRHEPQRLADERDRIVHHVTTSGVRALHLNARIFGIEAQPEGWLSNVTWIAGGYAMALSMGSPPKTFSLLADTGSDLTWLQSRLCTNCFEEPGEGYQPHNSSTYKVLACSSSICQALGAQSTCVTTSSSENCTYGYEYGDHSNSFGTFSTESISMTTVDGRTIAAPSFAFGVGTDNSVSFEGVDGILGLGQGPVSFPSQLGEEYGNIFSYCLQGYNNTIGISPIIFGEAAVPQLPSSPYSTTEWPTTEEYIQYTPLQQLENVQMSTFWFVNLYGFTVDGSPMQTLPPGTATIIDSGTTISMLMPAFYEMLRSSLIQAIKYPRASAQDTGLDLCFNTNHEVGEPTFPEVTFHFQLADWVLPRDNSFISIEEGTWCLAMMASAINGIQIFGNVQQSDFQVVYDQPNARLGFLRANCDSL